MQTLILVFMSFASIVCAFSIVVITAETVREMRSNRRKETVTETKYVEVREEKPEEKAVEKLAEAAPAEVAEETKAPDTAESLEAAEESKEPEAAEAEGGVWIATTGQSKTLEEKYFDLSVEAKGWYDEIQMYVMAKSGIRRIKNTRYEEYKIGNQRIVKLTIKREVIQCEYVLVNSDFRNYIKDNKVSVKTAPTVIRIESSEAVDAAKNSIDIAIKAAEEEREYKREQQRERRRLARASKKDA